MIALGCDDCSRPNRFEVVRFRNYGSRHRFYSASDESCFALLAASGLRIGEALAIEIGTAKESTTTLSADCRVVYVRTQLLQDGDKQDCPKTAAGVREVDIHPDVAALLLAEIGIRKNGYLFATDSGKALLQSNLRKNVFDPIVVGRERDSLDQTKASFGR